MSDETLHNPFVGFSQGAFDDTPVIFRNVRFASNVNYKDGDGNLPIVLNFDLTNEDGDVREDQLLSIGKGFEVKEDGARVEHENPRKNKSQGFGQGTKAQTFLDSLAACDLEKLIAHGEKVDATPREAVFWEGLACYVVEEEQEYTVKSTGEVRKYRELKATEVYNWDGVIPSDEEEVEVKTPAKKVAAKKAAAKKTPPAKKVAEEAKPAEGDWVGYGLADDVFAELQAIAQTAEDYDAFLIAAYDLDAIADDDVQTVVDDEAGFWTTHRGPF